VNLKLIYLNSSSVNNSNLSKTARIICAPSQGEFEDQSLTNLSGFYHDTSIRFKLLARCCTDELVVKCMKETIKAGETGSVNEIIQAAMEADI